jgi:hypothetical protein
LRSSQTAGTTVTIHPSHDQNEVSKASAARFLLDYRVA